MVYKSHKLYLCYEAERLNKLALRGKLLLQL